MVLLPVFQHTRALIIKTTVKIFNRKSTILSGSRKCPQSMEENMDHVSKRVHAVKKDIIRGLETKGFAMIDNFLGAETCVMYRQEAENLFRQGDMKISQSTKWDSTLEKIITYDKNNVYATQLNGGEAYEKAPRLHEYVVSLIKALVPALSQSFPEACLSSTLASNKLAVCLGDGSSYDKHFDNSGSTDLRKLTVLLYLNPNWRPELRGYFRMYIPDTNMYKNPSFKQMDDEGFLYKDIAPMHDRLLVFWSDRNVHSVLKSEVINGDADHRYALTVWIAATDPEAIVQDDVEVRRHFGEEKNIKILTP